MRSGGHRDDDVTRELKAHVELETEDGVAGGMTPAEARAAAMRNVGNVTLAVEQVRDLSVWAWVEQARQDIRYALRGFRRTPAFAVAAILTLALGVGANAAIFNVVDALILQKLPVAHPEGLIAVDDRENQIFSFPDYLTLRDGNDTLSGLLATSSLLREPVSAGDDPELVSVKLVTTNYFELLGVSPSAGQFMRGGDDTAPVAVISEAYRIRRFGNTADVVGRAIKVNSVPLTIIGVAPARFFGETPGEAPDIWASMAVQRAEFLRERGFSWLYLMGRLKPGVTALQAQSNLAARFASISTSRATNANTRIAVSDAANGLSRWRDRVSTPLRILSVIVGIVLLITCANLAGLLLTRGSARRREVAMRIAIGASRGRIVRQLLTEVLVLSAASAMAALLLAPWGSALLVRLTSGVGDGSEVHLNTGFGIRLLLFTVAVSIVSGIVFGLQPAIREARRGSLGPIEADSRVTHRERVWGLRGGLVAIQVALSLSLVAGTVMLVRTLNNLQSQTLGFRPDGLFRVEIEGERGYEPPDDVPSRMVERLARVPGVDGVTLVMGGTLANRGGVRGLDVDGYTPRAEQDRNARADWVGPGYFRVAGMRLVAGRDFSPQDDSRAPLVAVINQTAARQYFGSDQNAINRHFVFNKKTFEIVGVAENAKYGDLRETTPRVIYFDTLQTQSGFNAVEIRSDTTSPAAVLPAIRSAVREVGPLLNVRDVVTLNQRVDHKLGREHLVVDLSSFFGLLTLMLVSVGVYGTLTYTVGQRTREIGVRLALGAGRRSVVWLVLGQIAPVVIAGLVIGCAGALGIGRLVKSLLFGVQPTDAVTIVVAGSLLVAVSLFAALLPSLRAARLDPAKVLRES